MQKIHNVVTNYVFSSEELLNILVDVLVSHQGVEIPFGAQVMLTTAPESEGAIVMIVTDSSDSFSDEASGGSEPPKDFH